MTERLYYTDSYQRTFDATVVERSADGLRLYLDRTAFYPTSGGQPHDRGTLEGTAVVDVLDEGERVAHVLGVPLPGAMSVVRGTVDWQRRFDFMQQHTGQHLLSAMFDDAYGWPTVSVHFGDESSTLDVAASQFDASVLAEAERRANALVTDNREVIVTFEDAALAQGLRKPSDRDGQLRVVTIANLDRSACGGTHVARTGEIGAILLRRAERTKGNVRIEFLCGQRAVTRARHDALALLRAAQVFTAASGEVPRLVELQMQQYKDLEREHRRVLQELAVHEARARWEQALPDAQGFRRVHIAHHKGPVKELETLAQSIAALGRVLVLVSSKSPLGVLVATSADSGIDAGQTLRAAVAAVGGRGGGSPRVAQASVPDEKALDAVCESLSVAAS